MASGCRIEVRIRPQARRNAIKIDDKRKLEVWVTSPPVDGKANAHLLKMLSKALKVPKTSITFVSGVSSRKKVLEIPGLTWKELQEKLA